MMTKNDFNFIEVYEDAFDFSDDLIEFFDNNKHLHNERSEREQLDNIKDTFIFLDHQNTHEGNKLISEIQKSISKCYELYRKKYIWSLDLSGTPPLVNYIIDSYKVQKTKPGEGYNAWHTEKSYSQEGPDGLFYLELDFHRFLVYTIYLNDIEEGGETAFLYQDVKIKPKKGSLCLFPADFMYVHCGVPPINKTKYIVTGWLCANMSLAKEIKLDEFNKMV